MVTYRSDGETSVDYLVVALLAQHLHSRNLSGYFVYPPVVDTIESPSDILVLINMRIPPNPGSSPHE